MKAVVFTLGCKVNQCESASLMAGLAARGWEVSDRLEPADAYILNTCAVTAEAEKKSRQTVARALRYNPAAKVLVVGCASQKAPESFREKAGVTVVAGTRDKGKILDLLEQQGVFVSEGEAEFEELWQVRETRSRAYIKVQDGCENFCSYCIVPYLRGKCRSRDAKSVRGEIDGIAAEEAVITGINLSAYDREGAGLAGLMRALAGVRPRIRLGSLEVGVVTRDFLEACAEQGGFAPHFHLSLQSGSGRVLMAMNRKYTPEAYAEKVALIREYFPAAGITTDVIAGFPTETEAEFCEGLAFVRAMRFADVHCFPYSRRSGTEAAKLPDFSAEIKHDRLERLLSLKAELKRNFALENVGRVLEFLPEECEGGMRTGYTENYLKVYVADGGGRDIRQKVRVTEPYGEGARAVKAEEE